MANALDRSEKVQYHLVTFTWGSPQQVLRYTNWDSDLDPNGSPQRASEAHSARKRLVNSPGARSTALGAGLAS